MRWPKLKEEPPPDLPPALTGSAPGVESWARNHAQGSEKGISATHANHQPARPQGSEEGGEEKQVSRSSGKSAEAGCLHARVHDDPKEAKLGPP